MLMSWWLGERARQAWRGDGGNCSLLTRIHQNQEGRRLVCVSHSGSPLRRLSPGAGKFTFIPCSLGSPLGSGRGEQLHPLLGGILWIGREGRTLWLQQLNLIHDQRSLMTMSSALESSYVCSGWAAGDSRPFTPATAGTLVNWT